MKGDNDMLSIVYTVKMGKKETAPTTNLLLAKAQLNSAMEMWRKFGGNKPYLTNRIGQV